MNKIAIYYPAPRNIAYSSLFYRYLRYRLSTEGLYGGSVFLEDNGILVERGVGDSNPRDSRVVFSSLPFEIMYRDYAELLLRMGLNPWRRRAGDGRVIIVGGPAVSGNPLPMLPLVDAVLVGEIENVEDQIFSIVDFPRERLIEELAGIPGMLVPQLMGERLGREGPVERNYVRSLDDYLVPFEQFIPENLEPVWGRSYAVEASRGCSRGCRFCLEGFVFRPKRDLGRRRLFEHIEFAYELKFNKINFYSLSFFDNPWAEKALEHAISLGLQTSVPSVRIDTLNPDRIKLIKEGGQRTLTIAPETGSKRLCMAIRKGFTPNDTLAVVEEAVEAGFTQIKLYFMVGFPGETREDLEESVSLIEKASTIVRRVGGRIKISVNPFVPKPVTPLQWAGFIGHLEAKKRIAFLEKAVRRRGGEASKYDPKWARIQAVLSRGDSSLARLIVEWASIGRGLGDFRRALRESGVKIDKFLESWSPDYTPPWHRIVRHPFASLRLLRREYEAFISYTGLGL